MRCQVEKNKEILCDEMEKLSSEKMTESLAAKLSIYRGAYKALCMIDKAQGKELAYTARDMEGLASVNRRAYNSIMERLREVAKM